MSISNLLASFFRLHVVIRLLIIIMGVLTFFGSLAHVVEPRTFPTLFDGLWWAIVTTSTVGYGDLVPTTPLGRILAVLLILAGAGFVTYYMAQLSSHVIEAQNAARDGQMTFNGKAHIIIVGWNTRTKNIIHHVQQKTNHNNIVLIDGTLKMNPFHASNIHFIKGDSTQDKTLRQANIAHANTLLITADQNKNELQADMHSILTLIAAKGIQPNIYAITEILTTDQINNAWRAGADEVMESNMFMSHVMTNSLLERGMADIVMLLLDQLHGDKFSFQTIQDQFIGKTFHIAAAHFLGENKVLIGIKRNKECYVNPTISFVIEKGDSFILIEH
jgi:voltage-gated potassium channel